MTGGIPARCRHVLDLYRKRLSTTFFSLDTVACAWPYYAYSCTPQFPSALVALPLSVCFCFASRTSASRDAGLGLLEKERLSSSVLIEDYPGHESLWCYRRFVCQAFLVVARLETPVGPSRPPEHRRDDAAIEPRDVTTEPLEEEHISTGAMSVAVESDSCAEGGRYDWAGWNRAVTEWYECCLREDAELDDSEEDEHDDGLGFEERATGGGAGCREPDVQLPAAPAGGGILADFLGQEARFALKCATDKVSHNGVYYRRRAFVRTAYTMLYVVFCRGSYFMQLINLGTPEERHWLSQYGSIYFFYSTTSPMVVTWHVRCLRYFCSGFYCLSAQVWCFSCDYCRISVALSGFLSGFSFFCDHGWIMDHLICECMQYNTRSTSFHIFLLLAKQNASTAKRLTSPPPQQQRFWQLTFVLFSTVRPVRRFI